MQKMVTGLLDIMAVVRNRIRTVRTPFFWGIQNMFIFHRFGDKLFRENFGIKSAIIIYKDWCARTVFTCFLQGEYV